MTYTESETFKTEAGAVNWLACRGLDATGQRIEHNEPVREGEGPEASPFVTIDYQEQQEARKDRLQDRAKRAHTESEATYNQAKAMASVIPFGQPILVGHHSEQRDRRYRERIHNTFGQAFALDDKAKHYERKAANIGNSGIASNDPEAIKKLKAKLQKLENLQMLMKLANKALKKGDNATLAELGFDEGQIAELRKPDFAGRVGFASYQLQNNGAEIRRTKKRIEELELLRNSKPLEFENEDFSICIDNGRVVVKFPGGKPSAEVCSMMKAVAFKWSRYQGAWVRKATGNAVADAGRFLEFLKTKESIY
ncbi:MAG: DUF3560 domain-containing protein [Gammaproteobacteria bacterium]|nr:DUF3560 domain-containing protein [Gammaproteobacteria bacterium]